MVPNLWAAGLIWSWAAQEIMNYFLFMLYVCYTYAMLLLGQCYEKVAYDYTVDLRGTIVK